jgi:tetratricopeptide (TPR) repeat protein
MALEQFWVANNPHEGVRWFTELLDTRPEVPEEVLARALRDLGGCSEIGGGEGGEQHYEQSLEIYRRLNDASGVARLLHRLAGSANRNADYGKARMLIEESRSMAGPSADRRLQSEILHTLGHIEWQAGNHEAALDALRRSAEIAHEVGFTWLEAGSILALAEFSLELGRIDAAERWASEGLSVSHSIGDNQWTVYGLSILAWSAALREDARKAGFLWGAIEAEESRAYHGAWVAERHVYEAHVMKRIGAEFDEGRREGRRLSLDQAVERAGNAGWRQTEASS